jgi:DNA-directed RNA polymerase specialized sigma24 family protein
MDPVDGSIQTMSVDARGAASVRLTFSCRLPQIVLPSGRMASQFPSTMWTEIASATLHGDTSAAQALGDFYERYREPVRRFILRKGFSESDAEDLTHEFFLELMRDSALRNADRTRGKFRSFLLGAAVRFLHDEKYHTEDSALLTRIDEAQFDRLWALSLVESAFRQLEIEFMERGRGPLFAVLKRFLPGGGRPGSYQETAAELGVSESSAKVEIHRLRSRFRELLRADVLATVTRPHEVQEEMRYLAHILRTNEAETAAVYARPPHSP